MGVAYELANTADTQMSTIIIRVKKCDVDLEVPLFTPRGIPGVLDQPVVQARGLISAVADDDHGMVYHILVILIKSEAIV